MAVSILLIVSSCAWVIPAVASIGTFVVGSFLQQMPVLFNEHLELQLARLILHLCYECLLELFLFLFELLMHVDPHILQMRELSFKLFVSHRCLQILMLNNI